MRRKDREISDKSSITAIIENCRVCRLGLVDGNIPYIVPLCFGYEDGTLYFHGALRGRRMDLIKKNPKVCFEFDRMHEILESDNACSWGVKYESVIGQGRAFIIDSKDEKIKALNIIMARYSDKNFVFPDKMLKATSVIRLEIESMTGKCSGF